MVEELYTPEELAQMHDSLWQCVLQFANMSAAQERNRIARDLHDSLGHALTALNFQLQTAMKLCKPDPNQAQEFLNEAHRLVGIATQEVRQSVKALRSDNVETQSLETLVESLVSDFEQTTGITPEVKIDLPVALSSHLVAPIYRIIQEALNNIRKYAQATAVQLHICTTSTGAYLIIKDNGRGFDIEKVCGGYGLQGMKERVAVLKGRIQLESQLGEGCCISVGIPMNISRISEIPISQEMILPESHNDVDIAPKYVSNHQDLYTLDIANIIDYTDMEYQQPSETSNSQLARVIIGEWQPLDLL